MRGNPYKDPTLLLFINLVSLGGLVGEKLFELARLAFSKKYRDEVARQKARELIWKLKQRGYIEEAKKGQAIVCVLSKKGKIKLIKNQIKTSKQLPAGNFLTVIFDIPQTQKSARNMLRGFLKANDFKKLQQSVWITRQEVYKILVDLIEEIEITDWVKIFYGKKLYLSQKN